MRFTLKNQKRKLRKRNLEKRKEVDLTDNLKIKKP
jgi:hypothetical protein